MKTFNFLCAGNKDFVKYQAQGGVGGLTPNLSLAYVLELHRFEMFYISIWRAWRFLFGSAKPTKAPPWRRNCNRR